MKIRTKLSLFFAAIFCLVFLGYTFWFANTIRYYIIEEIDRKMDMMGHTLVKLLDLYKITTRESLEKLDLTTLNSKLFVEKEDFTRYVWLAFYDDNFTSVIATEFAKKYPITLTQQQVNQKKFFYTFKNVPTNPFFTVDNDNNAHARIRVIKIHGENFTFYMVSSLSITDDIKYILKIREIIQRSLIILVGFVLVIGTIYSFYMLYPINNIMDQLNDINNDNLSKRIKSSQKNDEISVLADSINYLLERIEKGIILEKQFISDVSHEFKTPIFILRLNIESVLVNEKLTDDEIDKLTNSLEILYSMGGLIEKLLYLTRLEQGSKKLITERIEVESLIKKAIDMLSPIAEHKNITLKLYDQEAKSYCRGDKDLLYTALFNLIENGIKYTDVGTVTVYTSRDTEKTTIRVVDTGRGIPEDKLESIFERFYRIDMSRTAQTGYGIGLTITKRIIILLNGTITVKSTNGKGTEFTISIPR